MISLLKEYEDLFNGILGHWTGKPYHMDFKAGVKPYYSQLYLVPKGDESTTKMETKQLC